MANVICPYCFNEFKPKDVMFRCKNASCPGVEEDKILQKHWKVSLPKKAPAVKPSVSFFGGTPKETSCPKCGQTTYWMICPHCHNRLDTEMVLNPGKIISIVGTRSSGKTNYITSLIEQLKRYGNRLGRLGILDSTIADDKKAITSARYKRDFLTPLFKEGRVHAGTDKNDPYCEVPLIYTINQDGRSPLHLVLYDTAGENLTDEDRLQNNVRYLEKSDAIIFLFDVTSVPEIHDKLIEKGVPLDDIEFDLEEIIKVLCGQNEIRQRLLSIPKAVVFNKFDLVLDYLANDIASFTTLSKNVNSSFIMGKNISLADIESVSDAIRDAITTMENPNPWNDAANMWGAFPKKSEEDPLVCLFGVSALGRNPINGELVDAQGKPDVHPYRVLDPLVWILYRLGYKLNLEK